MDVRAQAELRRKKILLNAEARLKRITGKTSDNIDISRVPVDEAASHSRNGFAHNGSCNLFAKTHEPCSSSEEPCSSRVEPHSSRAEPCSSSAEPCSSSAEPCSLRSESFSSRAEPCSSKAEPCLSKAEPCSSRAEPFSSNAELCSSRDELFSSNSDESNFDVDFTPSSSDNNSLNENQVLKFDCYFYLALGFSIRVLIYLGFSTIFFENILGPFIVACISKVPRLYRSAPQPLGIMILLAFIRPFQKHLVLLCKMVHTFRTLAQFLALYLFSFILTDFIISEKDS